jgi:hypothetical protein
MVDSHHSAVPEILAAIPIGDPADNPRGGVFDPPVAGSRRSQRGCRRRWLSLQLGTKSGSRELLWHRLSSSKIGFHVAFEPVREIGSGSPTKA